MKHPKLHTIYQGKDLRFSQGLLVETLQNANITTDEAILLTKRTEKHFRNKKITFDKFMAWIAAIIKTELDNSAVENFLRQTPVFLPIKILNDKAATTFSKHKLAKSLQHHLTFKDAHKIAAQVESNLRTTGTRELSKEQLLKLTAEQIEKLLGNRARLSFEQNHSHIYNLQVTDKAGRNFPYSHSIVARSLVAIGLELEFAHQLARKLEQQLWQLDKKAVNTTLIRKLLKTLLHEEAGEDFAKRYDLIDALKHPKQPLLILIGGTTGVGKSTLAAELAYRLNIPQIVSSDAIRQALRSLINPALSPMLHSSSYAAWHIERLPGEDEKTKKVKPKQVLRAFTVQSKQVGKALLAILERYIQEGLSVVMEGVHLVPGFLNVETLKDANIIELVLAQSDEEKHRKNFEAREVKTKKQRSLGKYIEHFREIRVIQEFIVAQAKTQEAPIIELGNFDEGLEQVIELTMQILLEQWEETGD